MVIIKETPVRPNSVGETCCVCGEATGVSRYTGKEQPVCDPCWAAVAARDRRIWWSMIDYGKRAVSEEAKAFLQSVVRPI